MITLNTEIETLQTQLMNVAETELGQLRAKAMGYATWLTRTQMGEVDDPVGGFTGVPSDIGKTDSDAAADLTLGMASVTSKMNSDLNAINAFVHPPTLVSLGTDPLAGWAGKNGELDNVWPDIQKALTAQWDSPDIAEITTIIQALIASPGSDGVSAQTNALARSEGIYVILRDRIRGDGILKNACIAELDKRHRYQLLDIGRYCAVMLDQHGRDELSAALSAGVTVDELLRGFSARYGEIYAVLTDVLISKAKKETGWFYRDYKARLDLWSSAEEGNASNYLKVVENAVNTVVTQAERQTKRILSDFKNAGIALKAQFGFDKLDTLHDAGLDADKVELFDIELGNIYSKSVVSMTDYVNSQGNSIGIMSALASGYSSMLLSVGQTYLDIYSGKRT